jgi:maleate isomerase
MEATTIASKSTATGRYLPKARARIGLIIPAVNSLSEPQFNHFAPPGLTIHVARAQITGTWRRPVAEMTDEIKKTAGTLADCSPDIIVFHCTDSSMQEGPDGEQRIIELIRATTGIAALSTSRLVAEALAALDIAKVVVISPYQSNDNIIRYLGATGCTVVHDVKLGLQGHEFCDVPPERWLALAREHDRPEADGIFLSCTNTTQIEAIADAEILLHKPVVNSNQAVLWGCLTRLKSRLGPLPAMPELGLLMRHIDG